MKNLIKTIMIIIFWGSSVLCVLASSEIKTLPDEMYSKMQPGKKMQKVWISPDYDQSKGFAMGKLKYAAENRIGEILDCFSSQIKFIVTDDSPYKINISIVHVEDKTIGTLFGFDYYGDITVEGSIVDSTGNLLAAFRTKGDVKLLFENGGAKGAVDEIISAIQKDLAK